MSRLSETITEVATQYLRLHLADGIGPVFLGRLIKQFGTIDQVLKASIADLCEVEGIGERRARSVFDARSDAEADREIVKATEAGVRIICWEDPDYPAQLRHCDDPPICLYVRGALDPADAVSIAIVGSRKCSRYGYDQARRIAGLLAGAGFTVVSGLARGIDGYAHEGALEAKGRTLAVLGCGVDTVYPPEHADLATRVMEQGALLAEDPLGSPPTNDSFPRRNRIIAGLSLGTVVVEAGKRSGALITARLASDYNREVFAVPGRVDTPTAIGPNDLIRRGAAKLVGCLDDILDELGDVGRHMGATGVCSGVGTEEQRDAGALWAALSDDERSLLRALGREERDVEDLIGATDLPVGTATSALTMLQLKGAIVALPGNRFVRRTD